MLAMLIGAVALGVFSAERSAKSTVSSEEAGASLTDSERAYVESVYDYLNELRAVNETRRESRIMNMDLENVFKTELTYMISVDDSENMEGVEQAYKHYLSGTEFLGYISRETGIDIIDISDLVNISYENSRDAACNTVVKIMIISADKSEAEKMAQVIKTYLNEKNDELFQSGYQHEISEIGDSTYQGTDLTIKNRQLQYLQEVQSRNKTIMDAEKAFKDAQKTYYDSLVNDSEEISDLARIKQFAKYISLGMFMGAFVMFGIYFLTYILANRLDEDDDVEGLFGTYLIGIITGKDYSKAINKLRHIGKKLLEYDESVRLVSTKIKMTVQKEGITKIGILGCGINKYNEKVANDIIAALAKDGVDVVIIDEPTCDSSSVEKLLEVERVIFLEKAGVAYRTEIQREMEMVKKYGIKVDGLIISE